MLVELREAATLAHTEVTLDDATREHIERALRATAGRIYGADGAARLLAVKPTTLQSRMKKLGVRRG